MHDQSPIFEHCPYIQPEKTILNMLCNLCEVKPCIELHKLASDALAAEKKLPVRAECSAKTRAGTPCKLKALLGKNRCRLHGGLSTGPKTPEGKMRISEAQKRRWKKL
ncbi:HGGxSTG domain-containing protein [Ahrensia kielensis]|uniref:HGGxSTG domain-containing protein n=1 Tax=Ahrensia kielensis TaxID=76980 RepID=UPI00036BE336